MIDELLEKVDTLLDYFEVSEKEWPFISIWSQGSFYTGPIPDSLYDLLVEIKELRDMDLLYNLEAEEDNE